MDLSKVRIPSVDHWGRMEYIDARKRQHESEGLPLFRPDRVDCYRCKKEISTPHVHLVHYGRHAACDLCYSQLWENHKVTYRSLLPDGSLGILVEHDAPETSPNSEPRTP